jgi:hypothetical protein
MRDRDNLLAVCSQLQSTISDLQRDAELANEKEREAQTTTAHLQAQEDALKLALQEQGFALASAVEDADASRNHLHLACVAARAILDQLQMTNESSRDFGSTLSEVHLPHHTSS